MAEAQIMEDFSCVVTGELPPVMDEKKEKKNELDFPEEEDEDKKKTLKIITFEEVQPIFSKKEDEERIMDMKCAICREFLKYPAFTSCKHTFCVECLKKSLSGRQRCPICSKDNITYIEGNVSFQNMMNKIMVKCRFCEEEMSYERFENHFNTVCMNVPTACPRCNVGFYRRDLAEHRNTCSNEIVPCVNPNCLQRMLRCKLQEHVLHCVYGTFTCFCKEQVVLCDRKTHLKTCTFAQEGVMDRLLQYNRFSFNEIFCLQPQKREKMKKFNPELYESFKKSNSLLGTTDIYPYRKTFMFLTSGRLVVFPSMDVLVEDVSLVCGVSNKEFFVVKELTTGGSSLIYYTAKKDPVEIVYPTEKIVRMAYTENSDFIILFKSGCIEYGNSRAMTTVPKKHPMLEPSPTSKVTDVFWGRDPAFYFVKDRKLNRFNISERGCESRDGAFSSYDNYYFSAGTVIHDAASSKKQLIVSHTTHTLSKYAGRYTDKSTDFLVLLLWFKNKLTIWRKRTNNSEHNYDGDKIVAACILDKWAVVVLKSGNLDFILL